MQPHLKKCFEGIQKLRFDDNKKIHGMESSKKEFVEFLKPVVAGQQVEAWLIETEVMMKMTCQEETIKSMNAYPKLDRNKWVLDRCGMTVLSISMLFWTQETEVAIEEGKLKEYEQQLQK